jgi:hypothetical protein
MTIQKKSIRIGGASGYWGDSQEAPRQLVDLGNIDYLVFDYLAEVTMSILARAKSKNPNAGYAGDFVELAMKPLLKDIKAQNIKVVANAGGVNIAACAAALKAAAEEQNISLKIGIVEGDDITPSLGTQSTNDIIDMFTGAPCPEKLISANAYLGAFPIAAALSAGADIVITGRCVDSAVTLGPLIHEFGWSADDFDKLAAGSLAGHIIECGAQATGGNFTDWREVVNDWDNMGYPIADCLPDGTFSITKPDTTGGLISNLTVGEQILYEIGDPSAYILPDVVCDFTSVKLNQKNANQLEVTGVKGRAPTQNYKVSATYQDGYRSTAATIITGFDAAEKGRRFGEALLKRTRRIFKERGLPDYTETAIHLIGAETLWGGNASPLALYAREITARIDVRHPSREALELFSKETTGVALSMTTGRCSSGAAGRPKVTPVVAQFSFLIDKLLVSPIVHVENEKISLSEGPKHWTSLENSKQDEVQKPSINEAWTEVPLIHLAVARSGDKGDTANIGVIARTPHYLPYLAMSLTPERVKRWFMHVTKGDITRYSLPGMNAFNFVLTKSLGGGGTSSLHVDSQAKTYAQQILAMPISIPTEIARKFSDDLPGN